MQQSSSSLPSAPPGYRPRTREPPTGFAMPPSPDVSNFPGGSQLQPMLQYPSIPQSPFSLGMPNRGEPSQMDPNSIHLLIQMILQLISKFDTFIPQHPQTSGSGFESSSIAPMLLLGEDDPTRMLPLLLSNQGDQTSHTGMSPYIKSQLMNQIYNAKLEKVKKELEQQNTQQLMMMMMMNNNAMAMNPAMLMMMNSGDTSSSPMLKFMMLQSMMNSGRMGSPPQRSPYSRPPPFRAPPPTPPRSSSSRSRIPPPPAI